MISPSTAKLSGGKVTFANLSDPKNPTYELSDLSIEDVELGLGEPSNGADTIVMKKGKMHWTKKSIKQIHKENGGTGNPGITLMFSENKIITLFGKRRGLVPIDGSWKITMHPPTVSGQCEGARGVTPSGLPESVRIQSPFHPNQIINPRNTKLSSRQTRWKKITSNTWKAPYVLMHRQNSKIDGVWNLEVLSKKSMKLTLVGHVVLHVRAAGLFRECTATSTASIDYIGN